MINLFLFKKNCVTWKSVDLTLGTVKEIGSMVVLVNLEYYQL